MSRTLGSEFQQARIDQGFSLEEVSKHTFIKVPYLEALERGDIDALPSMAQARGFIRVYANYLNLDPQYFLDILDGPESDPINASQYNPYKATGEPTLTEEEQKRELLSEEMAAKSDQLMLKLGESLRHQREILGLSLEDVERHTHLRSHYLEALEQGNLESLPSPVQGRGMLKNYADFLGMDPDPMLLLFADALQAQHISRKPERTKPRPPEKQPRSVSPIRRLLSGDLFLTGGIVLILVLLVTWGVFQIASARSEQTVDPTAPSIADVLAPLPTVTSTILPTQDTLAEAESQVNPLVTATEVAALPDFDFSQGSIQVVVSARQRGWLRVTVDGEVEFEGQVIIGTVYPFSGSERIEVLTGNAGGMVVYYNDQNLGTLGLFGEVANRIFTANDMQTPTPTITPTPTETPRISPTLPATQMPGG